MATAPKDAPQPIPQGTAYGRGPQKPADDLTRVGPGTPMGELMRRYWQPVLASRNVTERPKEVRLLGEDLIIFRDGEGRPGLLYPRCMHRGTSLFWGHVERDGIRCCYHGWKFAVDGQCIEQPCEPNPTACRPEHRQPWYPVRDHYGLVWAYMGPPDRMPALPRFDAMEPLDEGEEYLAFDNSLGSHGDFHGPEVVPYSWLHMNDNVMDPFHVQVLHTTFSGTQFVREFEVMPRVEFDEIEAGVTYQAHRDLADGRHVNRVSTWMMPNVMFVPDVAMRPGRPNGIGVSVPVDDTHCRIVMAMRVPPTSGTARCAASRRKTSSLGTSARSRSGRTSRATTRRRPAKGRYRCTARNTSSPATRASACSAACCAGRWKRLPPAAIRRASRSTSAP